MYIGVYVDDIILAGRTLKQLINKDLGILGYFLGMKVVQDEESQYGLDSLPMLKIS